jgi:hypothetical protein
MPTSEMNEHFLKRPLVLTWARALTTSILIGRAFKCSPCRLNPLGFRSFYLLFGATL